MNAAFYCASLGITPTVRHADYIGSWLELCCAPTSAPSSRPRARRMRSPTGCTPGKPMLIGTTSGAPHRRSSAGRFKGSNRVRSVDRTLPEQRFDQRAFRQRAVGALRDHLLEHPLHAFQIGDLRPHVLKVCGGDGARLGTGLVALVDETQQLTDFIKGEAELARPQHEAKAPLMRRVIVAIAAGRARRFGQKTDLLVIADGLQ